MQNFFFLCSNEHQIPIWNRKVVKVPSLKLQLPLAITLTIDSHFSKNI